jgi:aspartate kinase
MIVMKFGGTSVKDAAAMTNVLDIIKRYADKKLLVVLSACSGITDKLIIAVEYASGNKLSEALGIIKEIESHHNNLIKELIFSNTEEISNKISNLISQIITKLEGINLLGECTPAMSDCVIAMGELLSSTIFNETCAQNGLKSTFLDARKILCVKRKEKFVEVDFEKTAKFAAREINSMLPSVQFFITQGFIGRDERGKTATLGRGGSDYSASILGASLNAEEIQIWTDVSGILSADPRLVPEAKTITTMTFNEVVELSFFGAKVVHPDTIQPAMDKKQPVRILNTFHPEDHGTLIASDTNITIPQIHSIVLNANCFLFATNDFEIDSKTNTLLNIYADLEKFGFNILFSSLLKQNIRVIAKSQENLNNESLIPFINKYNLSIKEIDLLSLVGNLLDESKSELGFIHKKIIKNVAFDELIGSFLGASKNTILILTTAGNGPILLKKLHNALF